MELSTRRVVRDVFELKNGKRTETEFFRVHLHRARHIPTRRCEIYCMPSTRFRDVLPKILSRIRVKVERDAITTAKAERNIVC
jgi:hypothetical protein